MGIRLPRTGSTTRYCFGDDDAQLGDYAWYGGNSDDTTHPVAERKPNAWGLYDMHGSVFEWCDDWYDEKYYAGSPMDDPAGPTRGSQRVLRGGCLYGGPNLARSGFRTAMEPEHRGYLSGMRVARVLAGN